MRAALYTRYSSGNQRQESITAQLRAGRSYCERKKYTIVREYIDEAVSAKTDDRPDFQRMIRDAKAGLFDVLVCHKIDRFARNRYDAAHYKRILHRAGVRVEYVEQQLDDSPESVILESVLEGMAEYYSKNLAREIMKGKKETAYQGKFNGGIPPLGYDVKDGLYVVNENEALTVRYIYDRYAAGIGLRKLVQELNDLGYLTKRKKPFGINSLHEILSNKKYCGILVFGKAITDDDGRRNTHAKHTNILEVPDKIPAIVPQKIWNTVEKIRLANARSGGRGRAKVVFLLSGLARCTCGSALVGTSSSANGVRYHYYICSSRDRKQTCRSLKARKDEVEQYVLDDLYNNILNPKNLDKLTEKINSSILTAAKSLDSERKQLEKERNQTEEKIERLIDLAEAGGQVKDRILQYQNRLQIIFARLKEIVHYAKKILMRRDQVRALVEDFGRQAKTKSPEQVRAVLQALISSVVISETDIEINYRFSYRVGADGEI